MSYIDKMKLTDIAWRNEVMIFATTQIMDKDMVMYTN